ncbi:unnamed protein product [Cladocopium goreaui]|uniref:Initiation-specific alpha-1,6-mannosyltransferase n=1 Tax=Cladocopium goreaui TaxID=2562237 RepID=A0A9P1D694_9DINO|nr:unnamed protein product [Cladocopium goreaui]
MLQSVNRSNVRRWIPDAPEELFRIPYEAAESDAIRTPTDLGVGTGRPCFLRAVSGWKCAMLINTLTIHRYALIYHNGGIYMDTDFLAIDMSSIIDRIPDHDIIGYTAEYQSFHKGQFLDDFCERFSSNFLAGKKGSKVMGAIWKAQKEPLGRTRIGEAYAEALRHLCYDDPTRLCSVRWAGLGEGISHPAVKQLIHSNVSFKSYMFSGDESFVPDGLVEVLKKKMSTTDALNYWKRRKVQKPLSRKLYHLFNSQGFADGYSCVDLTNDTSSVAGELYKRSKVQRRVAPHGRHSKKCANDGSLCKCSGMVFYGRRCLV